MNNRHWLADFFRWDARAILALVLGLLVLIGFAIAATETTAIIKFDFGGASLSNRAAGMVAVKGGLSPYPQTSGTLQYGWATGDIVEFSASTVADLMKRDYNSGPSGSIFKLTGLDQGTYTLKAAVGSPDGALSTRMQVNGLATTVSTTAGAWQIATLVVQVDTGGIEVQFSSGNGTDPWGICGLEVYKTSGTVSQAGFTVSLNPAKQTMTAGNTLAVTVGVTPVNNYGAGVTAKISGLVSGMTAEFSPAALDTLPGSMQLLVNTEKTVPATDYALLVTITGKDAAATKQTTTLALTVISAGNDGQISNGGQTPSDGTNVATPSLPVRSPQETKQDFASIDEFVAQQQARVLKKSNFTEMKNISDSLSSVPVFEALPQAKTTTEAILQKLVDKGIISSTVDSAPVTEPVPAKTKGFWANLLDSIVRRVT